MSSNNARQSLLKTQDQLVAILETLRSADRDIDRALSVFEETDLSVYPVDSSFAVHATNASDALAKMNVLVISWMRLVADESLTFSEDGETGE